MCDTSINLNAISIVHWFNDLERHKCGYCKNRTGSVSYGMWAETLTVEDYQSLIDRGWRRSGLYCYKPIMDETCCPQYTIKCEALKTAPTKSQKKVIKKFNKFLSDGLLTKNDPSQRHESDENDCDPSADNFIPDVDTSKMTTNCSDIQNRLVADQADSSQAGSQSISVQSPSSTTDINASNKTIDGTREESKLPKVKVREGVGADPDKPRCKKAKLIRLEKKQEKLQKISNLEKLPPKETTNKNKSLEEFFAELPENGKYKLRIELIPTSEPGVQWKRVEKVEFELYRKYQTTVHSDKDCTLTGFKRFLVTSPLKPKPFMNCADSEIGFGSYHQQYWLDDKLIAVGVIDILPKCISSVYFFYDPDYRNLTLGTYSSLRELQFTRHVHELVPSIQYYYMGYYIHSCPKMRYKGKLVPSYLLCPETYAWLPIEDCIPKLEASKYSRLNPDLDELDTNVCTKHEIDKIKVLADYVCMFYGIYRRENGRDEAFDNIGNFIGKTALKLLFVINK